MPVSRRHYLFLKLVYFFIWSKCARWWLEKVAFTNDAGVDNNFQKGLDLIKDEGPELIIIAGATAYDNRLNEDWRNGVRDTLGSIYYHTQ